MRVSPRQADDMSTAESKSLRMKTHLEIDFVTLQLPTKIRVPWKMARHINEYEISLVLTWCVFVLVVTFGNYGRVVLII